MARSGSVLLLLLSVIASSQSRFDVSFPSWSSTSGYSPTCYECNTKCAAEPKCTGCKTDDGTYVNCYRVYGDCRGPAADTSKLVTGYMAKQTCPVTCGCPSGFHRYGTRCLSLLSKEYNTIMEAEFACLDVGAHLAVPRSKEEHEQLLKAADQNRAVWLGVNYDAWRRAYGAADDCGEVKHQFWASGQPDIQDYGGVPLSVVLAPLHGSVLSPGWHTRHVLYGSPPLRPLCQLRYCYRPDCI